MSPIRMNTDPNTELPPELRQHLARHQAPPGLKRRISYQLRQQAEADTPVRAARPRWSIWKWNRTWDRKWNWLPAGVGFACGVLLAVLGTLQWQALREQGLDDQQLVNNHVRSLMVAHLTDVASTDQHTVKPWFTGRLDYAPPVADLAARGFPLVGGRLDYVDGRAVAALVYRHNGHVINVYVAPTADASTSSSSPSPSANTSARLAARQGFQIARWTRGGMDFRAISDLGREEIARFAEELQATP